MWPAIATMAVLFALGNLVFGRFEEGTPKWRRILKLALVLAITAAIGRWGGTAGALAWVAIAAVAGLTVHFTWCRRHGIDPFTAAPWARYRELRGWKP